MFPFSGWLDHVKIVNCMKVTWTTDVFDQSTFPFSASTFFLFRGKREKHFRFLYFLKKGTHDTVAILKIRKNGHLRIYIRIQIQKEWTTRENKETTTNTFFASSHNIFSSRIPLIPNHLIRLSFPGFTQDNALRKSEDCIDTRGARESTFVQHYISEQWNASFSSWMVVVVRWKMLWAFTAPSRYGIWDH